MQVTEPFIRWRPALFALALGLAALLRGMPGLAPPSAAGDPLLAAAHALCLGLDSAGSEGPAAPIHEGCDFCCLPGGRVLAVLPALAGPVPPTDVWQDVPAPSLRREARAPPVEAWAPQRGQRAPPSA